MRGPPSRRQEIQRKSRNDKRKKSYWQSFASGRRGINFEPRMTEGDSHWTSRDVHSIAKAV